MPRYKVFQFLTFHRQQICAAGMAGITDIIEMFAGIAAMDQNDSDPPASAIEAAAGIFPF
jgi:hypothetical protein